MSSTWAQTVPVVVDGKTKFNAADMNQIIGALTQRTDYLKSIINTTVDKNGYTFTDNGFTADCEKGTLVCYDPIEGRYQPASAIWDDSKGVASNLAPSYKAYVKGVVISDRSDDSTATVLCEGWLSDQAVINRLLGGSKVSGNYYLQADGTLSTNIDENAPIVFCCTYTTSGRLFLSPTAPEVYGHAHSGVTIKGSSFTKVTNNHPLYASNQTAKYAYDTTNNEALSSLLTAAGDRAVLIGNGTVMNTGIWGYTAPYLYTYFDVATTDTYTLYGITPIMGDTSIVRGVRVDKENNILTADTYNNTVYLNTNFTPADTDDMTGVCVTQLSNSGVSTGPVVQELTAGSGLLIKPNNTLGSYNISLTSVMDTLLDMQLVNLNGAVVGESNSSIYITFPAGIDCSVVGGVRIPASGLSNIVAYPVILAVGNGGTIPAFDIQTTVYDLPTADAPSTIRTSATVATNSVSNTSSNKLYRIDATSQITVSDNSYVSIRVMAKPGQAVSVLTIGLYIKQTGNN